MVAFDPTLRTKTAQGGGKGGVKPGCIHCGCGKGCGKGGGKAVAKGAPHGMSYTQGQKQMATIAARAKAQKSRMAWYAAVTAAEKGLARAHKQNRIVHEAVVKAQKLRNCYELDETKVKALEELL